MRMKKHFRIIVLGAGFSRPAGLLLADELFAEIRSRASSQYGCTNAIELDLEYFIDYKQRCKGIEIPKKDVDYEEFLGFLDVEHALGFRGSDTITPDGNQTQLIVKTLIGQIVQQAMPKCLESIPSLYLEFARRLQPSDWVLTFNYDTLLERALEAVGRPFRLFPTRYEEVHPQLGYGVCDDLRDEVVVLKLHGSIDWFDKTPYDEAKKAIATVDPNHEPR